MNPDPCFLTMNMKHIIFPTLIGAAALLGSLPSSAATQVASYPEAKAQNLISEDGIIVVAYADGWDKFSKKRAEKLLASEVIQKAAGKAVLLPLPIPAYTTRESKEQAATICGELQVPGANSYPALILLDAKGKHYATLCGREVARGKVSEVASLLTDRMAKGRKRAELLAAADAAKGPEKAKLTFDAYQMEGLSGFGKGFGSHIAKLDPQDATGAKRAANYDHYGLLGELGKMSPADIATRVDALLDDNAYTNRQKQRMCVAAIGVLRRNAGAEGMELMRRYALKIKALAPDTPEGRTSEHILKEWVKELTYEEGWSPACLPMSTRPMELKGKLPISTPGTYTVRFTYKGGRHALTVLGVELRDGNTKVAEDMHRGTTGSTHKNNTYTLKVDKAVLDPHVFISFDMSKNRDSRGVIEIEKN